MQSIERRSQPRSEVSCLVHVRRPEIILAGSNESFAAQNLASDSLYFTAKDGTFENKMQLLLTFPFNPDPTSVQRECLVEVVRTDSLFRGRLGVAARLLDNIRTRFRLHDGLIIPESAFWKQSWPHVSARYVNLYA
jgi:hypothetical protein